MELIGTNRDSSGTYRMYREAGALITVNGEGSDDEYRVQQHLVPAPNFTADDDDWYPYGTEGQRCDIHVDGEHARLVDGIFELVDDGA